MLLLIFQDNLFSNLRDIEIDIYIYILDYLEIKDLSKIWIHMILSWNSISNVKKNISLNVKYTTFQPFVLMEFKSNLFTIFYNK